jgi:hypothetical protein
MKYKDFIKSEISVRGVSAGVVRLTLRNEFVDLRNDSPIDVYLEELELRKSTLVRKFMQSVFGAESRGVWLRVLEQEMTTLVEDDLSMRFSWSGSNPNWTERSVYPASDSDETRNLTALTVNLPLRVTTPTPESLFLTQYGVNNLTEMPTTYRNPATGHTRWFDEQWSSQEDP